MTLSGCSTCPTTVCVHSQQCWEDSIPNLFDLFNYDWHEEFNEWAVITFGDGYPEPDSWSGGYYGLYDPGLSWYHYVQILQELIGKERTEREQHLFDGIEDALFPLISNPQARRNGESDNAWVGRLVGNPLLDGNL